MGENKTIDNNKKANEKRLTNVLLVNKSNDMNCDIYKITIWSNFEEEKEAPRTTRTAKGKVKIKIEDDIEDKGNYDEIDDYEKKGLE